VIDGEGPSFCAGADLQWMKSMAQFTRSENIEDSKKLYQMFRSLKEVPVPVICMVHGHVMGGALGLLAASDIGLAVDGTQFCFSEVRLGLAPAVISSFVANKVPMTFLQRYFLTAEVFDEKMAQNMGLVQAHGSHTEMVELKDQLIKKICQNGPSAVRASKNLLNQLSQMNDPEKETVELIANLRVSPEGQEGLKSFFEKRKPHWMEEIK
jgi:methylglutaconyl-CoA hydratase